MTGIEFKGWLAGYAEGIKGVPTKEQWEAIKRKMAEVYEPVPYHVAQPVVQPYPLPSSAPNRYPTWTAGPNWCTSGGSTPGIAGDNIQVWG